MCPICLPYARLASGGDMCAELVEAHDVGPSTSAVLSLPKGSGRRFQAAICALSFEAHDVGPPTSSGRRFQRLLEAQDAKKSRGYRLRTSGQ